MSDDWFHAAACRGMNPDLFFPGRGEIGTLQQARIVCHACPVASDCLAYALSHGEKFGVWGGISERQRRQLRQHQPRPQAPAGRHCQMCGDPVGPHGRWCRPCYETKRIAERGWADYGRNMPPASDDAYPLGGRR